MTIDRGYRTRLGLRPIINAAGTMTSLGASIIVPQAVEAMTAISSEFVEIDELQLCASEVIASATGGEAGFVTASAAAGIVIAVAAAMTGDNLSAIERLPQDVTGLRTEVLLQHGHDVSYGNSISQAIRMAGGTPVLCGSVSAVNAHQVAGALSSQSAAAVFVVAHTTSQYGMLSLPEFASICHDRGVPVIVDAASEYDLKRFITEGADLVICSGHKFLGGPTSGIIAGSSHLVQSCRLQNRGLGRPMKVGKESVAGLIAALDAWKLRDHSAVRQRERTILLFWLECLQEVSGLLCAIVPDPTGNPLDRLEITVTAECCLTAEQITNALAKASPPVMVRDHQVKQGRFWLDPCNLHKGEATLVAQALLEVLRVPPATFNSGQRLL